MIRRLARIPLLVSFVTAVVIHVTAVLPLVKLLLGDPGFAPQMESRFDPEDFWRPDDKPPEPPADTEIGIDAETPSTFTWVGYDEYREHLARLAEVEQAAFTMQDPAGSPAAAPASAVVETVTEAPEPAEEAAALEIPFESSLTALRAMVDRLMVAAAEAGQQATPAEPERVAAADPPPTPERDGNEQEAPAEEPTSGETEPQVGDPSDRESDATSTIEVPLDEIDPGKPIARPGLELWPQRPKFDTLTRLTAFPGNPLTEIRFGHGGVPDEALVLESSGDKRVDHAVEASLFRWRATGKAVDDLAKGETVDVRILIVLTRKGRKR